MNPAPKIVSPDKWRPLLSGGKRFAKYCFQKAFFHPTASGSTTVHRGRLPTKIHLKFRPTPNASHRSVRDSNNLASPSKRHQSAIKAPSSVCPTTRPNSSNSLQRAIPKSINFTVGSPLASSTIKFPGLMSRCKIPCS